MDRDLFRTRLIEGGLEGEADALLALAVPSVRLDVAAVKERPKVPCRHTPEEVLGAGSGAVGIASGGDHQLALMADGSVLAWGNNQAGQLGDGTRVDRTSPVLVSGLSEAVAVAAGGGHSLALCADGSVRAWGANGAGALGDGTKTDRRLPVQVKGIESGARAIFAAGGTSYVIMADGAVLGWGMNAGEWLGVYDSPDSPAPVPGLDAACTAIAAGGNHRLALRSDGTVVVWGWELLGDSGGGAESWAPRLVDSSGRPIAAVAAGEDHSLALTAGGELLAWGENLWGQLGDGGVIRARTPFPAPALDGEVVAIAAGSGSSLALMSDGRVQSWGWNSQGRLGHGTDEKSAGPASVAGLEQVVAIAPQAALTKEGAVYRWGGVLPAGEGDPQVDDLPLGATKLGGSPDLPEGTPWPSRDGRPMAFLAQLDLAEVAPHATGGQLPPAGLLSFFCSTVELVEEGAGQVIYTDAEEPLRRLESPSELPAEERFAPAPLQPAADLTGAPYQSQALEQLGMSWEQRSHYGELLGQEFGPPVHRMLGHPEIVQNDPRDETDRKLHLLLQVDSEDRTGMMWGDLGRLYWWIAPEDLEARRFDRCLLDFQCH